MVEDRQYRLSESPNEQPSIRLVPAATVRYLVAPMFSHDNYDKGLAITLRADLIARCSEALVLQKGRHVIGVATLSPRGGFFKYNPGIVGLYVVPHERRKGYGTVLMRQAIRRLTQHQASTIELNALSVGTKKIITRLPHDMANTLYVHS